MSSEKQKKKAKNISIYLPLGQIEKLESMGVRNVSAFIREAIQEKIDASTLKDGSREGQMEIRNRKLANAERELRRLKNDADYGEACRNLKEITGFYRGRFLNNLGEAFYHIGIVNDPYYWWQDAQESEIFDVIFKVTNEQWETIKEKKWLSPTYIELARHWERYHEHTKAHEKLIEQQEAEVEKLQQNLREFMRGS